VSPQKTARSERGRKTNTLAVWVYYGGNCMSGGCGCVLIQEIVPGDFKIINAVPCGTSRSTAPQDITNTLCG
jgi:hypothetical protein